ncbi:hypothetical protein [Kocuria massiliensis]|uniref:hypothetical protein n=1 Tax=Kocuria massiliensis TaxID=1926282 RepID=UPI0022B99CBF|nr:hypothetical protein [Kocuria massiliensis]
MSTIMTLPNRVRDYMGYAAEFAGLEYVDGVLRRGEDTRLMSSLKPDDMEIFGEYSDGATLTVTGEYITADYSPSDREVALAFGVDVDEDRTASWVEDNVCEIGNFIAEELSDFGYSVSWDYGGYFCFTFESGPDSMGLAPDMVTVGAMVAAFMGRLWAADGILMHLGEWTLWTPEGMDMSALDGDDD